ncbi:MAG: MFS transporter [Betaproteobacteria bacterium]|nr:MAG: MFS transporter [Betaproteobacteria bacterium]
MLLLTATTFAAAGGIHYQTPMLGAMAAEFGADSSTIGWVPTLTFGGFLVGIVLLVPLGDRVDKRRLIITQHFAAMLALLAAGAAQGVAAAAASGFLIGLCACYAQNIVPMVAELAPPGERGRAVGTVLTALFLGILFARITGGIVAAQLGWRWMYVLGAALLALIAPALIARLPHSAPKTTLAYPELLASMLALARVHADMRRVVAIQLLLGICYGGFWATIATMLLQRHGLGPTVAGLIGIPGAAGILIARPAGRWLDLRGPAPIVTTGIALIIAAYGVFAFGVWWPAALAVGAALLDSGLRAAMVANQTVVNSLAPEARSRSNTVFGLSVWSGNAVGAFIATSALAASGWLAVCAISALAAAAALGVQLRAMRNRGQSPI